ncbi:DoxX family protein [Kribbella catacumbae]|uniref:DoxX family protein n=1 Tax=Kribbella catacumbae TaxID=460086 RepID=UPI001ED9B0E1|nr:DoxX family protein [Kribbella catacumbae]
MITHPWSFRAESVLDPCRIRGQHGCRGRARGRIVVVPNQTHQEDEMSTIGTATRTRKVRPGTVALWILQLILASQFVMAGVLKLSGNEAMVTMFTEIGAGHWFRYVVGVLEVAGALGLLVPRLCGLAALGLAGVMAGAVVTNVFVLGYSPVVAFAFLLAAGLIAWFRRSAIREQLARLVGGLRRSESREGTGGRIRSESREETGGPIRSESREVAGEHIRAEG